MVLYDELKRRNVFRVAVAYVITSWLLIQALDLAADAFEAPAWVIKMFFTLLVLGFVPTLLLSWAYQLTPDGLRRESESSPRPVDIRTAQRLDYLTLAATLGMLSLFVWQHFSTKVSMRNENALSNVTLTRSADATLTGDENSKTIAVLPFLNMSDDPENEYFSDGVSEELLNELVRIDGLKVASRTSAFSFKNKNVDIPTVAKILRVDHILEGSVRRSGNQVRISAQLIDVQSDKHLWSHIYTHELKDVFVIQDKIAAAIADALKLTLLGDIGSRSTHSVKAHDIYLLGLHWFHQRTPVSLPKAIELFEQVIILDPEFAPAYSGLADAYSLVFQYGDYDPDTAIARAGEYANKAIALDPNLSEAHASLGLSYAVAGEVELARESYQRAIALNPNYSMAHMWLGTSYDQQPIKALESFRAAERADPLNPIIAENIGDTLSKMGRYEEAADHVQQAILASPETLILYTRMCVIEFSRGRFVENYHWARKAIAVDPQSPFALVAIVYAETDLGNFEAAEQWLRRFERTTPNHPEIGVGWISLLESRGDYHGALQAIEEIEKTFNGGLAPFLTLMRGVFYLGMEQPESTIAILGTVTERELDPGNYLYALATLAIARQQLEDQERAMEDAEKGLLIAAKLRASGISQPWITESEAILLAVLQRYDEAIEKMQAAYAEGDRNIYGFSALSLLEMVLKRDDRYEVIKHAMFDDVNRQQSIVNAQKDACKHNTSECELAEIDDVL